MAEPRPRGLPGADPLAQSRMTVLEHLEELRKRIVRALIAPAIAFAGCWTFRDEIAELLARPIYEVLPAGTRLAFLGLSDPFVLYFKMTALVALFVSSPFVFYQVWKFVAPGLHAHERRYALPFIAASTLFFVAGGFFAYKVAFPFAVDFLIGMGQAFEPVITADRYYRFLMYVIFGLGLMFELPILIFLLAALGVVTPRFLMRHFRWAVILIFVLAAVVTPTPDVVNLCVFAVPTIGLYLLGVGAAALAGVGKKKRPAASEL
ncbi:MAG: twin-arginine translocase subunit TatC [Acidobacteriota bacterium]|nr:twin-arginine translocase subunit TatC [Acidobacteriota bacterium]MDH3524736.1 twin-arginine translocase subunit TatC [Acidobacteriota bacterium]